MTAAETIEAPVPDDNVAPPEAEETPAEDTPTEEIIQPGDLPEAKGLDGKTVAIRSPQGFLALEPGKSTLNADQRATLIAIGIDMQNDPGVLPHARVFIHLCQSRGLDPYAREAYLIGRGSGANRKWTMQVGIDGYRKIAATTGRFIRVKSVKWTGKDDDPSCWVRDVDDEGDIVMRRVWFDQWPESKGEPGAAKVTIEHLDLNHNRTTTSAVADWGMYAPYVDKWDWHPTQRGKKVYVKDENGNPVKELTDMWAKGGPFMLAKCAEALAHRKAFPAAMNGFYVREEMHRLDAVEEDRLRSAATDRVTAAYQQAHAVEAAREPQRVGDVANEVVAGVLVEEGQPREGDRDEPEREDDREEQPPTPTVPHPRPPADLAGLREELTWHASVLGIEKVADLPGVKRTMRKVRTTDPTTLKVEDLHGAVRLQRPSVAAALRAAGRHEEADALGAVGDDAVYVPEPDVSGIDPARPHRYFDNGGACRVCGRYEDETIHA